jgi:hypothetical protein
VAGICLYYDYVYIDTVTVNNSLTIHTDNGDDQVDLENVTQAYLNIDVGYRTNRVDLNGVTASTTATL